MSAYKRFAIQAVYDFVCLSARDKIKNKYLEGKTPKSFDIMVKDLENILYNWSITIIMKLTCIV